MNTTPDPNRQTTGQGADPSMEDILASIRRILSEEDTPQAGAAEPAKAPEPDDVLVLEPSMLVDAEDTVVVPAAPAPAPAVVPDVAPVPPPEPARAAEPPIERVRLQAAMPMPPNDPPPVSPREPDELVAPDAALAAASSLGSLMRTVASDRGLAVSSHGLTIEDIVRQEIRLMLKTWLDVNLPPLVERLVQAESERVAGRAAP